MVSALKGLKYRSGQNNVHSLKSYDYFHKITKPIWIENPQMNK